jgi:hypothetical protein
MRASTKQPQGDFIEYKDFLGISNAKDLTRIPKGYLLKAVNFDVDVEMMLHRRRGYKILLPIGSHSLWSNEFVCFFVSGGDLYRLMDDLTYDKSKILSGVGNNRMEYIDINGIVYFTNNQIIGYVQDGVAYAFPEVDQEYKEKMIGGQLLEFYDSRLYTAQDDTIFYSDAGRPMVMDERHNFLQCSGRVRMVKSVVDGLYTSEGEHVFFYTVSKDDPPKFKKIPIIDVPCFEGMAIKIEGEKISPKVEAVVVIWPGGEGVFMGKPGGEFERLTGRNFFLGGVSHGTGAFLVRDLHKGFKPGFPQYVGVYNCLPGFGEGEGSLELPILTTQGVGKTS